MGKICIKILCQIISSNYNLGFEFLRYFNFRLLTLEFRLINQAFCGAFMMCGLDGLLNCRQGRPEAPGHFVNIAATRGSVQRA